MFQLINTEHKKQLSYITEKISKVSTEETVKNLQLLIDKIREDIPPKKKISYGRYSIIKMMGLEFYTMLEKTDADVFSFSKQIYEDTGNDPFIRSLAVQLISIYGLEKENLKSVLILFEKAAGDESWEVRECSAGFVRKLIKQHPDEMKQWFNTFIQQVLGWEPNTPLREGMAKTFAWIQQQYADRTAGLPTPAGDKEGH